MSDINPNLIEKARLVLVDEGADSEGGWHSWRCFDKVRYPAPCGCTEEAAERALSAVADDLRAEGAAQAHADQADLLRAMNEYAEAIRGDWSGFDGRSEKAIIQGWASELADPHRHDLAWWRSRLGICTAGGGHWCGRWGYCDDACGCEPCAEDLAKLREAGR